MILRTELQRLLQRENLAAVGRKLGVSRSAVCKWLAGSALPSPRYAPALIAYFSGRLDHNGIYQKTPDVDPPREG